LTDRVSTAVDELDPQAVAMLGETIVGQLSFVGLDGYPRVVPVWFDFRDGEILISNAPGTYKCRSIGRGARVGFAVSDPSPPYRLVTITGEAGVERLPEADRIRLAGGQARRYLGDEAARTFFGPSPGDGELIRIRPRTVRFIDV
jgi:nitroimidazol reductase NimA-like FMN-containing flavoprotein (pyridoxamine 5'-phosphate oxidase superfamily)